MTESPCKNLKNTVNASAFEQLKTKEKIQVLSKRMNPAFACVRVDTLVHLPAFTGERFKCSTSSSVQNECSVFIVNELHSDLELLVTEQDNLKVTIIFMGVHV